MSEIFLKKEKSEWPFIFRHGKKKRLEVNTIKP